MDKHLATINIHMYQQASFTKMLMIEYPTDQIHTKMYPPIISRNGVALVGYCLDLICCSERDKYFSLCYYIYSCNLSFNCFILWFIF